MSDEFKIIYQLLSYLREAMKYIQPDDTKLQYEFYGIPREQFEKIFALLVEDGYIAGVKVVRSETGTFIAGRGNARITLKGLEYLEENSIMNKVAGIAKGIYEVIKK